MLTLAHLVRQREAGIHSLVTAPTALGPNAHKYYYVEAARLLGLQATDLPPVNIQVVADCGFDVGLAGC